MSVSVPPAAMTLSVAIVGPSAFNAMTTERVESDMTKPDSCVGSGFQVRLPRRTIHEPILREKLGSM
eukprot:1293964-Pyramimonas_sp.AAC.1